MLTLVAACATVPSPSPSPSPSPKSAEPSPSPDADDADREEEDEPAPEPVAVEGPCPADMVLVAAEGARFCVDKYEASLLEIDGDTEKPYPHWLPVDGHRVRAVSVAGVFPQGFISEVQADDACMASGKRLCTHGEWKTACMGPSKTTFPYGEARRPGVCHDTGKSAVAAVFGAKALQDPVAIAPRSKPAHSTKKRAAEVSKKRAARAKQHRPRKTAPARASKKPVAIADSVWSKLNDPRLGKVEGALATTGSHEECVNDYGAVDMMGNLHEWVKTDPAAAHGTFAGGYFLDTSINGDGCNYRTTAHAHDYHDYSTGFRCCADAR